MNRRQIGVSFAASHLVHLFAILALSRLTPVFTDVTIVTCSQYLRCA